MATTNIEDVAALATELKTALSNLVALKVRIPLLQAVVREFNRMAKIEEALARNDVVLQLVRDSFDMLVIDLASLCEGLTKRGFFTSLKKRAAILRRFVPEDVCESIVMVGERSENDAYYERLHREDMARRWNEVFERLFPGIAEPNEKDVEDLIRRFRKDVEPTDRDRNRLRAHRFERSVDMTHFQSIDEVSAQIDLVGRYLNDLLLVLTRGTYSTRPVALADFDETATDLADVIVHGSIDRADAFHRTGRRLSSRDGYANARAAHYERTKA